MAAKANIGAARALYYPNLSLTAALASTATMFSSLLSGPATARLIGANLAGPVFTFGAIEGKWLRPRPASGWHWRATSKPC